MKRYALLGALLALGVIACQQPPPPPPACATTTPEPASSVTETTPIKVDNAKLRLLQPADIGEVQSGKILADPTGLAAGDIVASNCNEGLLRKVTNVTTQTSPFERASPQGIKKVYIETADTSLEQVITDGAADVNYGSLDFSDAQVSSSVPGVYPQAVTGTITIKNAQFVLGVTNVTLNGSVKSTLDPKFNLTFEGGSVKNFEASLGGSLTVDLTGAFNFKAGAAAVSERELWSAKFQRAFLIGAVPVVVVVTPRLLIGASIGAATTATVSANIKPTLTMAYGIKYTRGAQTPWTTTATPPSFTLNPSFSYTGSINANAQVYTRFLMDIKFYGVAGPVLDAKPYISLDLNANGSPLATLNAGVVANGSLNAGFKILGAGLDLNFANAQLLKVNKGFNCTSSACTAQ